MDPTPTLTVPMRIPAPDGASCSEANFSEGQIQESPDQLESLDASIAWQQLPRVIGETRDTTQALRTPEPVNASRPGHSGGPAHRSPDQDRKSTRLNSSHSQISYAVFCLKKKKTS